MKDYKIDEEFKALLPEPSSDIIQNLEDSFRYQGYKGDPIIIWKGTDIIVDGHHRYALCKKYDIEPEIKEMSFKDRDEVITWMVYTQIARRSLDVVDRLKLAEKMRPKLEQEAKDRQRRKSNADLTQTFAEVRGRIADIADTSRETVRKFEKVINSGNEELKEEMLSKKKTINAAHKELRDALETERKKNQKLTQELVEEHKEEIVNASMERRKEELTQELAEEQRREAIHDYVENQKEELTQELVEEKPQNENVPELVIGEAITKPKQKMGTEEAFAYLKEQFARINEFVLPNKKYLRDKDRKVKYYDKFGLDITDSIRSDIYFHFNDLDALCSLIESMELEECGDTIAISINQIK
ncbi:MAG: hypothetical protein LUH07_14510 [Lachnospiraceae bacterium]|nr:hypothetical protein [Lachnospiraceae bacterium]